ncbi:hypothetical protein HZA44_04840 [Candidatus Peregrinibacteria bacterium]|nr:hypothetical protein [Candidatus Peregrinibacteria bacterium]
MKKPPSSIGISELNRPLETADSAFSTSPEGALARSVRADIHDSLDSIHASKDLERKLTSFIVQCKARIDTLEDPVDQKRKIELLEKSEIHLMHALGDFYESLDHLSSSDVDLDEVDAAKLSQVRASIAPDFLNRITNFYQSFEQSLAPVLAGAATHGADYFMDKTLAVSETAAQQVEGLLRSMLDGIQPLVESAQLHADPTLSAIDHQDLMRKMNSVLPKRKKQSGAAEGLAFSMLSSELGQRTVQGIEHESPEALKNMLLDQIRLNLGGMSKGVANQVLSVFEKEEIDGKTTRILSLMEPARQLELLYDILNMSIGFARNARLQKTLLSSPESHASSHSTHFRLLSIK